MGVTGLEGRGKFKAQNRREAREVIAFYAVQRSNMLVYQEGNVG